MINKNLVLVSGAVLYKEQRGKIKWFLTKQVKEDSWEIAKVVVRKGESSVRAALRMMGEKGGMTTRVLEEAGRAGGTITHNNKTFPQRHIYYLMMFKFGEDEAVGFSDFVWLEYPLAVKKISTKRERVILKQGYKVLKEWKKNHQRKDH